MVLLVLSFCSGGFWLYLCGTWIAGTLCFVEFRVSVLSMLVEVAGVVGVICDVVSFAFRVGNVSWFVMLLLVRNWL